MGKEKAAAGEGWSSILGELLRFDLYKRSQGRIVRQVTGFAIALAFALAAWRMYEYLHALMSDRMAALAYAVPTAVLMLGLWISYRIVNYPTFADFLIAVEAELNKVSWPSRLELVRASIVVIVLMFGLTLVLFGYDFLWTWLLETLGITIRAQRGGG